MGSTSLCRNNQSLSLRQQESSMKTVATLIAVTSLFCVGTIADASTAKGSKGGASKGSKAPNIKATQINKDIDITNNKIVDKSRDTRIEINAAGKLRSASPASYFGGKAPAAFSVKTPVHFHGCCHHHWYTGWSRHCWLGHCYGHYCPTTCGWYYWYEPFQCYLPVSYLTVYVPTVVAVPTVVTPAPATVALPMGATALPANFVPALPGTLVR